MEKRCFGLGINLRFLLFNKRKLVLFFLGLKTTPLVEVEEASVQTPREVLKIPWRALEIPAFFR